MQNPFEGKPYQPSPEEVKKAEEMMTEKQKEKSEEREATIEVGRTRGIKEIKVEKEKEQEKIRKNYELAKKLLGKEAEVIARGHGGGKGSFTGYVEKFIKDAVYFIRTYYEDDEIVSLKDIEIKLNKNIEVQPRYFYFLNLSTASDKIWQ